MDRLTKLAHFLPVKSTDTAEQYAQLHIKEIVRLHGTPVSIILDRGAQFTTNIWKKFQQGLGTQVNLSTTFHPQTDGQAERTIQTLEDMLRVCVLDFKGPDLVHQAMEKVKIIKEQLKTAQNRQKSYSNKVVGDSSAIVPIETIKDNEELLYEEILVAILDRQVQKLRNKEITSVKVLWRNQQIEEATWEAEEEMKKKYPRLFE
ncbi:uncharacterized protein [Nicotiana sylvestris]|uniref:uncharacterized protein n=1 Tax=Nicotiana sylvestris TaxID=4096 RepID=UPI00388C4FFB